MDNFLDGLHPTTTTPGASDSPAFLAGEALFTPQGERVFPTPATDGQRGGGGQGGGGKEGKQREGGGAAENEQHGGNSAHGGDEGGEGGEGGESGEGRRKGEYESEKQSSIDEEALLYPERSEGWMHLFTLIFCLIGRPERGSRPSNGQVTSGPPCRPAKQKGHLSNDGDGVEVLSPGEGSGGMLTSTAIRMFAGAEEPQSQAKVKDATVAVAQRNAQITNPLKNCGSR